MKNIQGYRKEERIISLIGANIISILGVFPIFVIYGLPFYFLWGDSSIPDFISTLSPSQVAGSSLLFVLYMIISIAIHELIHGITWSRFTENGFSAIKFGIVWKMLTPYCHCKEPLLLKQYILGAIMPSVILGLLPALYAILTGSLGILVYGMFMTLAAVGDFMIVYNLRHDKADSLIQDHSSAPGCFVFVKDNVEMSVAVA